MAVVPELPDVAVYVEALERRIFGQTLEAVRVFGPSLVRTAAPPLSAAHGREVRSLRRIGKRIAIGLEGDLWLVLHLMIAGRLEWKAKGAKPPGRRGLAIFDFSNGSLLLTEAGSRKRARLHVIEGEAALAELDPGGMEPLEASFEEFQAALRRENHTLKRALTDPTIFSGIGNAYSDEIFHAAKLSPVALTQKLPAEAARRLYDACRATLELWLGRLRAEAGEEFPRKVTAFRPEMAVHGKYGQPCPRCGSPIQRIRFAENETNYCPTCQTGGRLLADRSLSRLMKGDWPRTLEELEARRRPPEVPQKSA